MRRKLDMEEMPMEPGFTVPDRYFEELPTRIMQRTAYATPQETAAAAWFRPFKTALAGTGLALVFVLSFLASPFISPPEPSPQHVMASIPQQDIYQYLTTQVDLETADLAEVPAVKTGPSLEFLDVRSSDLTEENTRELLEEYEYHQQ